MSESEAQAATDTTAAVETAEDAEETTAAEETQPEVKSSDTPRTESTITSLEDALKEVAKLRKENASKRTKAKQVEEAARQWQEHVDSQKSELQKMQDAQTQLEKELSAYRLAEVQAALAEKHGVDPDLAEFIVGSDEDQMVAAAKKLAAKSTKTTEKPDPTAKDYRAGTSKSVETDSSKWFKQLFE